MVKFLSDWGGVSAREGTDTSATHDDRPFPTHREAEAGKMVRGPRLGNNKANIWAYSQEVRNICFVVSVERLMAPFWTLYGHETRHRVR